MTGKLFCILCLIAVTPARSAPSTISFYSVSLSLHQDTLRRVVEIRGIQGSDHQLSRIARGYNPETQSITLERAIFGFPEGDSGPVPRWSVDTLSGSGGWPLSLVTVFPALREGMTMEYTVEITDWSGNWREGAWAVLSPSVKGIRPDTCEFSVAGDFVENLRWHGTGYEVSRGADKIEFTADDSSGVLVISPFSTFTELEYFILREVSPALDSRYPPDLREAALQATSAGADEYAQSVRAKSLLCNSINRTADVPGTRINTVHTLQEILDRRSGTALEVSLVFAAMCRELGMQADILPASETDYGIPVPVGWNRYLVRLETDDGHEWFVEPSANLTSSSYIYRPDTLFVIENGNIQVIPPNEPFESSISEEWHIDSEEGTFSLEMKCTGWYDMMLRRKLAGLSMEKTLLSLSEWSWLSGRTIVPDSCSLSDPFDLGTNMALSVFGTLWIPAGNSITAEYLPAFSWAKPEDLPNMSIRKWFLSGIENACSPISPLIEIMDGGVLITDTSGISRPIPVFLEVAE